MARASERFAKKAGSDLALAQAIAAANRSGEALGTAMFLAQQSAEGQLMSVLLRAGEAVEAGLGAGSLGGAPDHVAARRPAAFYQECLGAIGRAGGPAPDGESRALLGRIEHVERVWDPGLYDPDTRDLLFLYSLGVRLPQGDLDRLYSSLCPVFGRIGGPASPSEQPLAELVNRPPPGPMDRTVSSGRRLKGIRAEAASHPLYVAERRMEEGLFSSRLVGIRGEPEGGRGPPRAARTGEAMLMILDYGVLSVAFHSLRYAYLVPHLVFGRRPVALSGGRVSTEVYASQRDEALLQLFVDVQYEHDRLREATERVDGLFRAYGEGRR